MLIWISEISSDPAFPLHVKDDDVEALSFLGEAGSLGRHVVVAPRDRLRVLAVDDRVSARARSYYFWMAEAITQYGSMLRVLESVSVSAQCDAPIRVADSWLIPLGLFSEPDRLLASELICENENDFCVLTELSGIYLRRRFQGFKLSLRSRPGGGSTTAQVLRSSLREPNPITLCVVDSDQNRPGGAVGNTARLCQRELAADDWRVRLHVLACRELENILPTEILFDLFRGDHANISLFREFSAVPEEVALFACVKSGESLCRFHGITVSHGYFEEVRAALEKASRVSSGFRRCGIECQEVDCKVVPQLGDDFLSRVAEWLPGNWHKVSDPSGWRHQLVAVIEKIVSVGLSFPRRV